MRCLNCDFTNAEDARVCERCGQALYRPCHTCGERNEPDARYCKSCGRRLLPQRDQLKALRQAAPNELREELQSTAVAFKGERRPVTILFADIAGSTAHAARLDPEEWQEIVAGYQACAAEAIYRYEGMIAQLLGDGILAFFGAPIAHEDDPIRAALAALDLQDAIKEYKGQVKEVAGEFDVRVGIHVGTVVVGDVDADGHVEYLAFGDTPNVASRLQGTADPGMIHISEEVHTLVEHAMKTEQAGEYPIKGKDEPLTVYCLVGAQAHPHKLRGVEGLEAPLVGREEEFERILSALEQLKEAKGGVITIVGEAGIGKSRLVAEARSSLKAVGVDWLEGRCLSYGGSIPYMLWLDAFSTDFGIREESDPNAVCDQMRSQLRERCGGRADEIYPFLARMLSLPLEEGLNERLNKLSAADLRNRSFESVKTYLRCMSEGEPLVLIAEDLHWADPTSLELLESVLQLTEEIPLLILCILRPDKKHPVWALASRIREILPVRAIELRLDPLDEGGSETLVDCLIGLHALPDELSARILKRSQGNPFFLEEILRSLRDQGHLVQDPDTGTWQVQGEVEAIEIPLTLQGVLLARLDQLQEETKRVLQMASVIGRIFLYRILQAIAEEERQLDDHLLSLQQEELIRIRAQMPELEYIFKHHLTQEAAYNGLLKRERRDYHRRTVEALEQLYPERVEENLGLLAYHMLRAEEKEQAKDYLIRAGDKARLGISYREAIDYYRQALEVARELGDERGAIRILMCLGLTYQNLKEFDSANVAYEECFQHRLSSGQTTRKRELPTSEHVWREPWYADVESLDPFVSDFDFVSLNLFSGLVELRAGNIVTPDIAGSWEILDGGMTYIFHLREDALWSDGEKVTAGDFEYAWKDTLKHNHRGNAYQFFDIKGAEAYYLGNEPDPGAIGITTLDDVTLLVELEHPNPFFLHTLALACWLPIPRHAFDRYGSDWAKPENIVTNGPCLLDSFERGDHIKFRRNPDYRGTFPGNLERMELIITENFQPDYWLSLYQNDDIDTVPLFLFPRDEMERLARFYPDEYVVIPRAYTDCIVFNCAKPPLDDPKVRQAFCYALDRNTLVYEIMRYKGFPATGGFIPQGMPGHLEHGSLPFDPERARQIIEEATTLKKAAFPELTWMIFEVDTPSTETVWICDQWEENLGIKIHLRIEPRYRSFGSCPFIDEAHIFYGGWYADYPDPDNFLRAGISANTIGWRHDLYQALVEQARFTSDHVERVKLYQEAERLLIEEMPMIPFRHEALQQLFKSWSRRTDITHPYWLFMFKDIVDDRCL